MEMSGEFDVRTQYSGKEPPVPVEQEAEGNLDMFWT
jgi:hypothetical protein